jgi:polyisoprenoid-binding protein YceI
MATWILDPAHSEISFKVKHLMITNVKGVFKKCTADVITENDNFMPAEITVRAETASIDTGDASRDTHLRSADFFDAEKYPHITFKATRFEKKSGDMYDLFGHLTIKDVTKEIQLEVEFSGLMKDPWGNMKAGFAVNGKINRKDWNLNWNAALEAGGVLVSDEVRISAEVQLVRQAIADSSSSSENAKVAQA